MEDPEKLKEEIEEKMKNGDIDRETYVDLVSRLNIIISEETDQDKYDRQLCAICERRNPRR